MASAELINGGLAPPSDLNIRHTRAAVAGFIVLLILWFIQVRQPPLSYPVTGLLGICTLCIILLMAGLLVLVVRPVRSNPAAMFGLVLIVYGAARWGWDGFAAVGAVNFGTLLTAGCYACAAYLLLISYDKLKPTSAGRPLLDLFLVLVSLAALMCAVHAVCQYLYFYDQQLARLQAEIGSREATPLELGLIHHFRAKRVASVWGDPNSLGCFLALSIAASISLVRRGCIQFTQSMRFCPRGVCVTSILVVLPALLLTQSRGAVIDLLLVVLLSFSGKSLGFRRTVVSILACCFISGSVKCMSQPAEKVAAQPTFTRGSTVRERMFYAQTGWKIITRNTVFGSGWGGVDQFYGRFKPVEARETKYLHNWVLQTWAEAGLVGLGLLTLTISLTLWRCLTRMDAAQWPFWIMAAVLCIDALIQHSFNQRELMSFAGVLFGILFFTGSGQSDKRTSPRAFTAMAALALCISGLALIPPWLYSDGRKNRAEELLETGNLAGARTALRSAMRFTPQDPELYTLMAAVAAKEGAVIAQLQWLRQAVSKRPQSASLHAQLGRALFESGNLVEAEREFRKALEVYPGNAQYHYDLATLLERKGEIAGALSEAIKAVSLSYHVTEPYARYARELQSRFALPNPEGVR